MENTNQERNALAELVTNLGMIYAENLSNDFYCDNIGKSLRIITELAKMNGVKEYKYAGSTVIMNEKFIEVFKRCLAIAEEGGNDAN